jgi:hypothetical protein
MLALVIVELAICAPVIVASFMLDASTASVPILACVIAPSLIIAVSIVALRTVSQSILPSLAFK